MPPCPDERAASTHEADFTHSPCESATFSHVYMLICAHEMLPPNMIPAQLLIFRHAHEHRYALEAPVRTRSAGMHSERRLPSLHPTGRL